MSTCNCNVSLGNTGQPGCVPIAKAQKKLIAVNYYDSTGAVNFINLALTLDATYFASKINHADASKRWYVLPELKNVTDEKGDSTFEEFDDNTRAFIKEGARNFTGIMVKGSTPLLGKLKDFKCAEIGLFIIDLDGNIIGAISSDGAKLNPIMVESPSWAAKLVKSTDTLVQKIMLSFQFHISERDEDLRMITPENTVGVTPLTFTGLIDVNSSYSAISTTGFSAKLFVENGAAITKFPFKGLLIDDFVLFNTTTSLAVTIISVTEASGTYAFTFAAQSSADVLRLTPTKNGADFAGVVARTVQIP